MSRELFLHGRLWVLTENGSLINDIDTDMIYHNAHLAVTEIEKMGQFAFGNLRDYMDFARLVEPGDIVLAGENFGSGSSRQHAVDCFTSLGVQAVVARSFGAIYKRNSINSGFPIVEVPGIPDDLLDHFCSIDLDIEKGIIRCGTIVFKGNPMCTVARDIYQSGGLFQYAESLD